MRRKGKKPVKPICEAAVYQDTPIKHQTKARRQASPKLPACHGAKPNIVQGKSDKPIGRIIRLF